MTTFCGTTKEDHLTSLREMGHEDLVRRCSEAEYRLTLIEPLVRYLKTAVNDYLVRGKIDVCFLGTGDEDEVREHFLHTSYKELIKHWVDARIDNG